MSMDIAGSEIEHGVEWMQRKAADTEARYAQAKHEGQLLSAAIARFLENPAGVGTNLLQFARDRYMAASAGGFCPPGGDQA